MTSTAQASPASGSGLLKRSRPARMVADRDVAAMDARERTGGPAAGRHLALSGAADMGRSGASPYREATQWDYWLPNRLDNKGETTMANGLTTVMPRQVKPS